MSYDDLLHRLEELRDLIHHRGATLSPTQRRCLLHRMESLADQLSYDLSGYEHGQASPTVPPRHDRVTTSTHQETRAD